MSGGNQTSAAHQVVLDPRAPMILHRLHAGLNLGDCATIDLLPAAGGPTSASAVLADDLLVGAGFAVERCERTRGGLRASTFRQRTLADTVGPHMRLLVCGLNPSVYAADAGVAFARPGNRFWTALGRTLTALADRDPPALLADHDIGLTDLVKRATVGADELTSAEYAAGLGRIGRLCRWLEPTAVAMVGLAGWRATANRKAEIGWQQQALAAAPVYVMPSTSGRNAHTTPAQLVEHFQAALADAPRGSMAPWNSTPSSSASNWPSATSGCTSPS